MMITESNLSESAKRLSTKNSHVRASTIELMDEWASNSECGEEISALIFTASTSWGVAYYYLVTGQNEIKTEYGDDYSESRHFANEMCMADLREVLCNFNDAANLIIARMDKLSTLDISINI